jgi:hypothetical protein
MLSGADFYKEVGVRVSTNKMELVLTFPMSSFMSRAENAFSSCFLDGRQFNNEHEKSCMKVIMKHHGKTVSRMVSISKIKGRSSADDFLYEQRIHLPRACKHNIAGISDGDEFFFGKKFIQYPDGSVHLHIELLCETSDGYHPEEVLGSNPMTHVASPANIPPPTDQFSGGGGACFSPASIPIASPAARALANEYDGASPRPRAAKRQCAYQDCSPAQNDATATDDADSLYDEFTVYSGGEPAEQAQN